MYKNIPGGEKRMIQGVPCILPPVGHGWDHHNGKLVKSTVEGLKKKDKDQYWQRQGLPSWYADKRRQEMARQKENPFWFDEDLTAYVNGQWEKRLYGHWFMNEGQPVYLTGGHWMYLNWWWLGRQYPAFRMSDLDYFYIQQYAIENPLCFGMADMEPRQKGKTSRGGLFIYEHCSRTHNANGGIQSKTEKDALTVTYRKGILKPFLKLPSFFRPNYDKSQSLSKGINFTQTVIRGKAHEQTFLHKDLGGVIDSRDSGELAYDGATLDRYVRDEPGKTNRVDIYESHEVIKPLLRPNDQIVGKMLYMTTVEVEEDHNDSWLRLWKDSDNLDCRDEEGEKKSLEAGGMTTSGLIRYFSDSRTNTNCNIYGKSDFEANNKYYLYERKKREKNPTQLAAYIRKYPFNWQEAFQYNSATATFDSRTINLTLNNILFLENRHMRRGNLYWIVKDEQVGWQDNPDGRWELVYMLENRPDLQGISFHNGFLSPCNNHIMSFGVDPFDHYKDARYHQYSEGAGMIKHKYVEADKNKWYNDAFICLYSFRANSPYEFYEDMILTAFFYSVAMLHEDQKPAIRNYFEDRGYGRFLQYLPGSAKPGVSASMNTKINMVNLYHKIVNDHPDRLYFKKHVEQLGGFDITDTIKSDTVMAGGYALIAEDATIPRQSVILNQQTVKMIMGSRMLKKRKIRV